MNVVEAIQFRARRNAGEQWLLVVEGYRPPVGFWIEWQGKQHQIVGHEDGQGRKGVVLGGAV